MNPFREPGLDTFWGLFMEGISWLYRQPERLINTCLSAVESPQPGCTFFLVLAAPVDSNVPTKSVLGVLCAWSGQFCCSFYSCGESARRHNESAGRSSLDDIPRPRGRGEDIPRRLSAGLVPAVAVAMCDAIPPSRAVVSLSSECGASGTGGRKIDRRAYIVLCGTQVGPARTAQDFRWT